LGAFFGALSWRPLGRPGSWFFWVHIRFLGDGGLGFRPYGGSLLTNASKVTKNACSCVRPARWGSGSLRCGIDPGAAPPVCFAAPPLAVFGCAKRSLRSHPRINPSTQPSDVARGSRSRAVLELALIVLSGAAAPHGAYTNQNCGSQPAGDGGLTAGQSLTDCTQSNCGSGLARESGFTAGRLQLIAPNPIVGAGLLAKAVSQPTSLQLIAPNPIVGAGLLAKAVSQPTNLQLNTTNPTVGASLLAMAA